MMKYSKVLTIFCVFILISAAACTGTAPKSATVSLKIGWTLWQGDYTLLIARQKGLFAKYGIDVQPIRYNSTSPAIVDLASIKLDGGIISMSDLILAANLVNIKGVLVSDNGGVFSIVGSQDITKVQQLRGKRIGVNDHTAGEMYVANMLNTGHMTSKDVSYVEMSPAQVPSKVPNAAEAGLVWEPYTSLAVKQGQKIIYQSAQDSALSPNVLVFRSTIINEHPEIIRNFLSAWNEGLNYRITHQQESMDIITKATGLPANELTVTKGTILYTIRDNIQLFSVNPDKDPTSIYHIAAINRDYLITNGYITIPPDLKTLLDPTYLQ